MPLSLLALFTLTTGPAPSTTLKLSPTPQYSEVGSSAFQFGIHTAIACEASSAEDHFAAQEIVDEALADIHLRPQIVKSPTNAQIVLRRVHSPLSKVNDHQSYRLSVTPNRILLEATTGEGIFYGTQTIRQLIRGNRIGLRGIPTCSITDFPTLQYRGWQHDISRGPIPSMGYLKKEIRLLSEFKLNMFTLYTEHVFRLKKHPTIAPNDGITAEEMQELSEYGKKYHVEVVGNFQSFGHFANILNVPGYEHLGENSWVISPAKEQSYKFLSDVYSEIAPAYRSPLFVINCDEVSGLGEGPSKDMVAKYGIAGVYAKHINRIAKLLAPYGKTPMMWGDIALNYPAIVPQLPKNLIVLPWAYDARANFEDQIQPFTKFGFKFMVSPGVSCWSQIWPDTQNATVNISNFVRDGARFGAIGMLNTAWDDDGQNLSNDDWYEFAWGGECAWNPVKWTGIKKSDQARIARTAKFDRDFPQVFYGLPDGQLSGAINGLSALRESPISGGMNNGAMWRDPIATLSGIPSTANLDRFADQASQYRAAFDRAKLQANHYLDTLEYGSFAAKEAQYLANSLLAVRALETGDQSKIQSVAKQLKELRNEYQTLWLLENRKWWLDKNLARYDQKIRELDALGHRVLIESANPGNGSSPIKLHTLSPNAKIYFTTDGSTPTHESTPYDQEIILTKTSLLQVLAVWDDGTKSPVEREMFYVPTLPCTFVTNMKSHGDNSPVKAFDGSMDSYFWSEGSVFAGDKFEVRLTTPQAVGRIVVTTGVADHPQDYLQHGFLEISEDGKNFVKVADFKNGIASVDLGNRTVHSIRLSIAGNQANWLVIREIAITTPVPSIE